MLMGVGFLRAAFCEQIESWRSRMRKLSSIIQQLKSDFCHTVFQVLHAVTKVGPHRFKKL